jgi:hypothetical protein
MKPVGQDWREIQAQLEKVKQVSQQVVGQFEKAACTSPVGVILSVAAARTPDCTTTEIQNLRKLKTLGNPT